MRDVKATIATLEQLKGLDIQLAIDDFGTGHFLAHLSQAFAARCTEDGPLIRYWDQSRPRGSGNRPCDHLTGGTEDQSGLLRDWACEHRQGYYFARPLNSGDFATLLQASGGLPTARPKAA